jgi:hypothetical protein
MFLVMPYIPLGYTLKKQLVTKAEPINTAHCPFPITKLDKVQSTLANLSLQFEFESHMHGTCGVKHLSWGCES